MDPRRKRGRLEREARVESAAHFRFLGFRTGHNEFDQVVIVYVHAYQVKAEILAA